MPKRRSPKTPTEVFREQVKATRGRRGWNQDELARHLQHAGATLDRSAVAKVESGHRGVSLDEALTFAIALGVPLLDLVLPRNEDEEVALAPALFANGWEALWWMRGIHPLTFDLASEADSRFFQDARPDYEDRTVRDFPGVHELWLRAGFALLYAGRGQLEWLREELEHLKDDSTTELKKLSRKTKGAKRGTR